MYSYQGLHLLNIRNWFLDRNARNMLNFLHSFANGGLYINHQDQNCSYLMLIFAHSSHFTTCESLVWIINQRLGFSGVARWLKLGGGGRDHWKYVKWFASQIRFAPKAQQLKGVRGDSPEFWNLEPLKRDFPHSESTFTTNFAVSTAQILRKNKEPSIIIYS